MILYIISIEKRINGFKTIHTNARNLRKIIIKCFGNENNSRVVSFFQLILLICKIKTKFEFTDILQYLVYSNPLFLFSISLRFLTLKWFVYIFYIVTCSYVIVIQSAGLTKLGYGCTKSQLEPLIFMFVG